MCVFVFPNLRAFDTRVYIFRLKCTFVLLESMYCIS